MLLQAPEHRVDVGELPSCFDDVCEEQARRCATGIEGSDDVVDQGSPFVLGHVALHATGLSSAERSVLRTG